MALGEEALALSERQVFRGSRTPSYIRVLAALEGNAKSYSSK